MADSVRLIARPEMSFADIDVALRGLGWHRDPDPTAPEPVIEAEPELASWSRPDGGRLTYGFNPAVNLRAVAITGPATTQRGAEVTTALQALDVPSIRVLLGSGEVERMLCGVLAVRELEAVELLVDVARLRNHTDPTIAREAKATIAALVPAAAAVGSEWLRQQRALHPGRSVLLSTLPHANARRQLVRWLIQERVEPNEHVAQALRSALEDEDWEVRLSAILAAARLRVPLVRSLANRVRLPDAGPNGLDRVDRDILVAARKIAVLRLDGRIEGAQPNDSWPDLEPMLLHLARCIIGAPVDRIDRTFLLVHSLVTPIPEAPPPDSLPPGVVETETGFLLEATEIRLVWVPAITHWLGDDRPAIPTPNPIREMTPSVGFFIAREPIPGQVGRSAIHVSSWDDARRMCDELARRSGADVALPSADEREMAVRGPDGRRLPWGNSFEHSLRTAVSPWGAETLLTRHGEWTRDVGEHGHVVVCGALAHPWCAARVYTPPRSVAAVRPIVSQST